MVGCSVHSGSPDIKWALVLHGGAGTIERSLMTKEREAEYRAALSAALETGAKVLQDGGTALDAVEATIRLMEDDPHFNAGRGAVFTAAGRNELDSSIMDGATLNAGAVAGGQAAETWRGRTGRGAAPGRCRPLARGIRAVPAALAGVWRFRAGLLPAGPGERRGGRSRRRRFLSQSALP